MPKQPPPAPSASALGLCPTINQISRTPRHWNLTQHLRAARPPPDSSMTLTFNLPKNIVSNGTSPPPQGQQL